MQTIDRMMKIIDVMISIDPNKYYTLTELSDACELPLSSLHRILKAMEKHEMILQDPEKKLYTMGTVWLEYGLKIYDTMDYVSLLRPELERLMQTVNASVYLTRPVQKESIIIERIDCIDQTIRTYDQLGQRTPIYEGSANVTMLAHMETRQLEKTLSPTESSNTIDQAQIEKIREEGFGIGEDDWSRGITTIAAPVINHYKEVVAAISIKLMTDSNLTKKELSEMVDKVLDTSNRLSWKIGPYY